MRRSIVQRLLALAIVYGAALTNAPAPRAVAPVTTNVGPADGNFYVAPDGRADGDGSRARPWDLATALAHPDGVKPGATIWLRGGTYAGHFVSRLAGRRDAHITIRPHPGEHAILDDPSPDPAAARPVLDIDGPSVTVMDLEVLSSYPRRRAGQGETFSRPTGINVHGRNTRLINNVVHDTGDCIGHWLEATDAEIYGNLMFFCGWDAADRGHGHGLYIQNAGGVKEIRDNIVFDVFGFGIHAYTEQGALDDLHFRRNVVFEAGALSESTSTRGSDILVGGRQVARRTIIDGNFTYRRHGANSLGARAGSEGAVVTGNHFMAGRTGWALILSDPRGLTMRGNRFYGRVSRRGEYLDNTFDSDPRGAWTFVLPNAYADRATVVVYNWDNAPVVSVDAPRFLASGDRYEIRDVQDYFGDSTIRTYAGGAVVLSTRGGGVATPIGWKAPETTTPTFGVFVLSELPR
ncbi:MAG: hypothetical protein AB7Q29_02210 [Vicinamibacterales bacterium]